MVKKKAKILDDAFIKGLEAGFHTWLNPLLPVIDTLYFRDLLETISNLYAKQYTNWIQPSRKVKVFKAFRSTSWDKTRIVILGQDPYPNGAATGLAFANPQDSLGISPTLNVIWQQIENDFYKGLKVDFDPSLTGWAEQGVLLLNTALTVGKTSGSHLKLWRPFTENVVKLISDKKEHVVFFLWGKKAQEFGDYIDHSKHRVFYHTHPSSSLYSDTQWKCPHFVKVNEYFQKRGEKLINW